LAVLFYVAGKYQTAIDHCNIVMELQDHSQCNLGVGQELLEIDDDVSSVLGLSVFYQYVRTAALKQDVIEVVEFSNVFTAELFARYLRLTCLFIKSCRIVTRPCSPSPASEIQRYKKLHYACSDTFIADEVRHTQYAAYERGVCPTRDHTKPVISCQLDTSELVRLLQQSAVEHLTKFRQFEVREFTFVCVRSVTTDFEALYAYKCGDYRRCLQLSTHNVRTLMIADKISSYILTYPELIQLMDSNIASLIALTLIVNMSARNNPFHFIIGQLSLSLYLMSQCQMKLHHSMMSLTQTLDRVEIAYRNTQIQIFTLDKLLLKLTERKLLSHLVRTSVFLYFFH